MRVSWKLGALVIVIAAIAASRASLLTAQNEPRDGEWRYFFGQAVRRVVGNLGRGQSGVFQRVDDRIGPFGRAIDDEDAQPRAAGARTVAFLKRITPHSGSGSKDRRAAPCVPLPKTGGSLPRSRETRKSGRRDLNSRPLDPQSSALTRLRHVPFPRRG